MIDTSKVKITISLVGSDLNDAEKNQEVEKILNEIKNDGVGECDRVADNSTGGKSISGYIIGKLQALVQSNQVQKFFGGWVKYITNKAPIEVEAEGNGKKIKLKINDPSEIKSVVNAIDEFINKP